MVYPENVRRAHLSGDFHIHDLNLLAVYCVGWDLFDLLNVGFTGVSGKISSRPPKHFRTALGQIVNFFYTMQGEAAGAQAFSNFDTLLAPFIRYDGLSYAEIKQAMQEFILQHQRTHPGRFPNTIYQCDSGFDRSILLYRPGSHHRRQASRRDLWGFPI